MSVSFYKCAHVGVCPYFSSLVSVSVCSLNVPCRGVFQAVLLHVSIPVSLCSLVCLSLIVSLYTWV